MRSLLARAQLGLPSHSKGQRPQGLATVALVLLLLQGIAHAQLSVPITTEREFYNALRDDDVTEVQVRNDIVLQADTWSGDGVVVRRSVNVTGAGANMPAIDFSYLSKKCVLATNVTIAFNKVMIRQTRYQLQSIAPGYDFFDKTEPPWATVYLDQAVSRFRACLPFDIAAAAASKLSRPVEWQGTQNVSETAVDPFCRTLPNGQQECWQYTGAQYDLAVEAATTNSVGNYLSAGYALVSHDSLYVCDVLMTTECINTYGAGNCFTRTGSMPAPPPTYRPGYTAAPSSKGASSTSVIAIAVPAAVGGCAVIALVVGLAVWNRRRRKQAFSSLPIRSTANGTGHTNGHSRGPTSDGQTAPPTGRTPGGSANSQGPALGRADDIHPSLSGSDPKYHKSADMFSGMESDWNKTDVFEDNPLTAVVMEQDPHLPTLRLEIDFLTEIQLIEGSERGTGSFGRVVEGIYKGERVAVKMIHPAMVGNSARSLKTFKQEVDILGKCRHRNIVQLIGACLTPPHIFLVEELMACSLDTLVHDHNKQFPLEQLLLIARDIACGLAYLHPTIIHRDLKPANVLLDQNGTAKLTDFGLARLRDCTLVTKHPEAGTAPYVAPECFDTSNYTITDKADMYSFAVVLWEMLSRASPWRGETPLAVAYKVTISKERLPLNMDESRCPRKLRKLIEECWDPDPRRRPSAAVAAKQLTLVLQQLQVAQDGTPGVNSFQTHNSKESA